MKNLKIVTPCSLKYDDLEKVDNSCRFCDQCNKKVYDFTAVTEENFMEIYKANDGNVCGLINTKKTIPAVASRSYFGVRWAAFFVSLMSFIGLSTSSCKSDKHQVMGMMTAPPREQTIDNVQEPIGKISFETIDSTETE